MNRKQPVLTGIISFSMMAAVFIAGCGGGADGETCSKDTDCGSNLTCQPVEGRTQNYCCPTPASASKSDSCKPAK